MYIIYHIKKKKKKKKLISKQRITTPVLSISFQLFKLYYSNKTIFPSHITS